MTQRLRFGTAEELYDAFPTADEDISAPASAMPSLEFARSLLASDTPEDGVTFLAYLLPRREAVWWAHQCLSLKPDLLGAGDADFLDLAENWVREPDDAHREEALEAGMDAHNKSPAVWVALAAAWSGGSMALGSEHVVSPPPELTAKAVNVAILSALARVERSERAGMLRAFGDMGLQLAAQGG